MRIFKFVIGVSLCFCLIFGLSPTVFAGYSDTYIYRSKCPEGDTPGAAGGLLEDGDYWNSNLQYYVDKWGFAQGNCTSYVADKINQTFDGMDDNTNLRKKKTD